MIVPKTLINANFLIEIQKKKSLAFQIQCPSQTKVIEIFSKIFNLLFRNKSVIQSFDIFAIQNKKIDKQTNIQDNQSYYLEISQNKYDELVKNIPKEQDSNILKEQGSRMHEEQKKQNTNKSPLKHIKLPALQRSVSSKDKIQQQRLKNKKQKNLKILEDNKSQMQLKKKINQQDRERQLLNLNTQRQGDKLLNDTKAKNDNTINDGQPPATKLPANQSDGCCLLI